MNCLKDYPYLNNVSAPPQILGLGPILNSYCAHVSAQRGTMLSDHLPQAQHIAGSELPHVYSGFEHKVGQYEYNTTLRDQDIQILAIIDKYTPHMGMYPVRENPYCTIVYLGANDNKVGYFNIERYTACTDGYGYKNKSYHSDFLNVGNFIPRDMKLSSSPAWHGSKYALGTNLNTAYMNDFRTTEDAFVISESAAKKLSPLAINKLSVNINADQILLNMAEPGQPPKFFPNIGETIGHDGVLFGLRKPTVDSIIHDMYDTSVRNANPLHDLLYYGKAGAKIIDINVIINRKCKIKPNSMAAEMYQQLYEYRERNIDYNNAVWEAYQEHVVKPGREVTPAMNTLVAKAVSNLLIDNKRVHGFHKKADISLYKNKDPIPFIHLNIVYAYQRKVTKGFKLTGMFGNKGTVSEVCPDDKMPVDDHGVRTDIICNPIPTISRMNMGQLYQHTIGRISLRNIYRMKQMSPSDAWEYLMGYLHECNPNYAEVVAEVHNHPDKRMELLDTIYKENRIYIQQSPMQKDIDTNFALNLAKKYPVDRTPVTYYIRDRNHQWIQKRSKRVVMVAPKYWMLLHKMPDDRAVASSHVNAYFTSMKAGAVSKMTTTVVLNPSRCGEDETRKHILIAGPEVTARIIGSYANSSTAKTLLTRTLMTDPIPSQIQRIPMKTEDMVETNSMLGVTRHIFSTIGTEIAPPPVDTGEVDE